jgi:DNA-binding beta-propeller fold protein YncE
MAKRVSFVKASLLPNVSLLAGLALMAGTVHAQQDVTPRALDLPTGKQLITPVPGDPRRTNSLPMSLAVSPDRRWVVSLNAGYGTFESGYMQSLAVLDVRTGEVRDFPDARTLIDAKQGFFSGLAFSTDGLRVYASLASSSDPRGDGGKKTGNGIVVYGFADGALTPEKFLHLPPVTLAAGRHTSLLSSQESTVSPYPAALAMVPGGTERLLVAENLSDTVALLDTHTGAVALRFDLSVSENVPATYPIALAVTKDGKRAFVALWNVSEVAELDPAAGTVVRHVKLMQPNSATAPGTHPCALLLDERTGVLYAALSNRDAVAAIEIGTSDPVEHRKLKVKGYFDTRLPGQSYFGAEPSALAQNDDGSRLYAANLGSDAVAVLDPRRLHGMSQGHGMVEPIGFVPTELMPMALASVGRTLYVASAKGKGTGPNDMAPRPTDATKRMRLMTRSFTYAPTLLYGSLAALNQTAIESELKASTGVVLESNRMKAARESIQFADGGSPIKHVIYILKENRTYDQVLGDLAKNGQPVGNGDPRLTMYGAAVTPNQHRLALQFGVLDNFFDSGEVSGDGHVWSSAGIGTDYVENLAAELPQPAAHLRLRRDGGRRLSAAAAHTRRVRAGKRLPVDELRGPWQDDLSLRRIHLIDLLQRQESTEACRRSETRCHVRRRGSVRVAYHQARRFDSGGVGRRQEPLAVGDSALGRQYRNQAGARGPLRAGVAGFQLARTRPAPRECVSSASRAVEARSRGRQ